MAFVNHNYPNTDDLRVVSESNEPVSGAVIRIFDRVAFDCGDLDVWVGATTTDLEGRWMDPIQVPDGGSWIVHIQKLTVGGPNHVELIT